MVEQVSQFLFLKLFQLLRAFPLVSHDLLKVVHLSEEHVNHTELVFILCKSIGGQNLGKRQEVEHF
ncbi:MAG: hypothetical protein AYK18_09270 [Theionarchaea archaeon DG-70]|nr:MAG: hypothetical protein AYK18_09270 [Theionarchaea archaeon DG-70]